MMKTPLTIPFLLLACAAGSAAATLQVDLNSTNAGSGPSQSGWEPWLINQSFSGPLNVSTTFAYADTTGGTLGVNLSTTTAGGGRSYGLDNIAPGEVLAIPDVWADTVFFNNQPSGSMTLTFSNLSAGVYEYTSYHYADNLVASPNNDEGRAAVSVDTGSGPVATGLDVYMVTGANSQVGADGAITAAVLDEFGTFTTQFTVANNGDTVDIIYGGPLLSGDSFGANGFELTLVPEPSTALLAAFGGLALLRRKRQR